MARREIRGSRAIVTGASSGIGSAIALELARHGAVQVVTARREERLRELVERIESEGSRAEFVVGDVTDPATRQGVVDTAQATFGGLDVLINNAGIGALGLFERADPNRLRKIMEVNFFALVEMTRLGLPLLKAGTRPIVVNVGSILGHRGTPHSSEYCASKFAVHGFSEALRTEVRRHGIDVLVVSPGTTETEFFDRVIERTDEPSWPEHMPVPPEKVARKTVRAIRRGRREIIPYLPGKILCWLNRLSPRLVDRIMARYA
ncbi:MAG: SDR family NAD(P)-dependent oxidoreductase [Planctomycetota bacterium]|jgi:short-subunit dehydrogenase